MIDGVVTADADGSHLSPTKTATSTTTELSGGTALRVRGAAEREQIAGCRPSRQARNVNAGNVHFLHSGHCDTLRVASGLMIRYLERSTNPFMDYRQSWCPVHGVASTARPQPPAQPAAHQMGALSHLPNCPRSTTGSRCLARPTKCAAMRPRPARLVRSTRLDVRTVDGLAA